MSLHKTFEALADPTRRRILKLLKKKDLSVSEITESFSITMPSISHHLSILKDANLVTTERRGQQIYYSINVSVAEELAQELYDFFSIKK